MDRKEKQEFHTKLIDLLLDGVDSDEEYFNRIVYALQIITNGLSLWEEEVKERQEK